MANVEEIKELETLAETIDSGEVSILVETTTVSKKSMPPGAESGTAQSVTRFQGF